MSTTDRTFTTRYKVLKGQVINKFHLQNPTKQLEGQTTPASIITIMNNSRATPSCCTEAPVTTPTILLYNTDQGSSFDWGGNTFTRTTNFSYTATITSIPASSRVPYHTNLIGVTIGNTVTSIGDSAFDGGCSALTTVTFTPSSILGSIGKNAFRDCNSLTSITIPNSVTSIGQSAFTTCSALTSVTLPTNSSFTTISDVAFFGCSSLTSLIIPTSVISIGIQTFQNCIALTSVIIPNSVTSIGRFAFQNCGALTSVTLPTNSSFTTISDAAFFGCSLLTSIIIPNSVTSIGSQAFQNCSALTSVIFTPSSTLVDIVTSAFKSCISLTSIIIPNLVTSIGFNAFTSSGLTTVTIANGQLGITSPATGVAFFGTTVTTILP